MGFRGWPPDALDFYEGLEADNSRTYWAANKATYDEKVHAPMVALLDELAPEFGPGKIFRPYRDVRFSSDKSPYKTHVGARLGASGYVQLSAEGLAAGRGMYQMTPDQLARYRQAVDEPSAGTELQRIITAMAAASIETHGRDQLKRVPRGFPADHPRSDLLRFRNLFAWRQWPAAAWLGTTAAKRRIVEFLRAARPLDDWLTRHVGPSHTEI